MKSLWIILGVCLAAAVSAGRVAAQEEESPPSEFIQELQAEAPLEEADTSHRAVFDARGPSPLKWYSMFTSIPGDWLSAGEGAIRPEGLPVMGGIALATGVLILGDHGSYAVSHGMYTRSSDVRFATNQILRAGDGKTTLGVAAAFALYGFVGDDDRALRTASGTVEALLASGVAVQLLKHIAGRESPQVVTHGNGKWCPFPALSAYNKNQSRYYAFPSGHITTVMATVTLIAENYPEERWIRPAGYGIVGLTAVSLVNKGWHWYSDFPLAIALGYTFGRLAAHHPDEDPPREAGAEPESASIRVLPNVGPHGAGVMLALSF